VRLHGSAPQCPEFGNSSLISSAETQSRMKVSDVGIFKTCEHRRIIIKIFKVAEITRLLLLAQYQ